MKEQEGMIQFMITKRVSQKDPGAFPFKLEGRQHVYQIIGIKTGEEYMLKRKIRRIISKESQYPGRKSCLQVIQ